MASTHTLAPSPSLAQLPAIHAAGSPLYTVLITISLVVLLLCALGMHFLIRCVLKCSRSRDVELEEARGAQMLGKEQGHGSKIELKLIPTAVYKGGGGGGGKWPWHAASPSSSMKERNTQCPICLSDFKNGEKIRVLPKCNHGFHVACVDAWLCNHPNCPTCRDDLSKHAASSTKCASTLSSRLGV